MSWHTEVFGGDDDEDSVPCVVEIDGQRYAALVLNRWAVFTWRPEGKFDGLAMPQDALRPLLAVETPREVSLTKLLKALHDGTAAHAIFGGNPYNRNVITEALEVVAYSTEETTVRIGWRSMPSPEHADKGQCLAIVGTGWRLHLQCMREPPPVFNFDIWKEPTNG
jgi:hypothetical protein